MEAVTEHKFVKGWVDNDAGLPKWLCSCGEVNTIQLTYSCRGQLVNSPRERVFRNVKAD